MRPLLLFLALLCLHTNTSAQQTVAADKIFLHGNIITVDSNNAIAQAIAVREGKILAVGSNAAIQKFKGKHTTVVDLGGKTVIPGFIDGHSHFMSFGRSNMANLNPPPVGNIRKIADIMAALQDFKAKKGIKDGEWLRGFGYDFDQLEEKRHPNRWDLDAAFPNTPVVITHVSGHMSVANSYALSLAHVDSTTPDPPGGVIERKAETNEPTGLLLEKAAYAVRGAFDTQPKTLEAQLEQLKEQQDYYASFGVTTAQDGNSSFESLHLLKEAASRKLLKIDVEALPSYGILDKVLENPDFTFGTLENHLKMNGFKLVSDGSPQGKTAFFGRKYLTPVPGCEGHECRGFPVISQEHFNEAILKAFRFNLQPYVHCNGDAAIDMFITAVENANNILGTSSLHRRPVVIHSQFVRPDQLDKYKELGMLPALFSNHAFFWGDVHERNLGYDRARFLSPLKTAQSKGIVATNHTDYGVTPINHLFLLWTSVERKSRSGKVIGPEECLTPLEGLRAITINGAYEYFEEHLKGSIERGKLADLVVLSADILRIPPEQIRDVEVLETIKEGTTIYKKQ